MVRKRITSIRRELKRLSDVRSLQRESRYGSGMFKVALAGYTNAGKSSLINRLTGADVLSYDKLFATLDSTTRKFELPEGREVTVTDTVGFIQKLPTTLVEAFKSTLDEITGADLYPARDRRLLAGVRGADRGRVRGARPDRGPEHSHDRHFQQMRSAGRRDAGRP